MLYFGQLTRNEVLVDEADGIDEYRLAFDQLSAAALDPEASRQRIAAATATWAREAGLPDGG
ncbi:MAG TPA: Scr1 family TA system antitoxin-like transcriptional regulator [Streptosporangiaceae bacterium]|nr:Scr1 family TA system antitoxin-like transcriptional regulator [Streptosporangiaceae bacterium]